MIDGKFDVVFRGQIVKNFELDTVKANLVKLFKSSPAAVDRLFSGAETPIRRGLDYTQAMKYQSALKNAGALALIKEVEPEPEKLKPANTGKATFGAAEDKSEPTSAPSQQQTQASPQTQTQSEPVANRAAPSPVQSAPNSQNAAQSIQSSDVMSKGDTPEAEPSEAEPSIAPPGTQILPDKVYEKREVDTSSLSLAAAGERILPEQAPEEHETPDIGHLSITDDTTPISGERESS